MSRVTFLPLLATLTLVPSAAGTCQDTVADGPRPGASSWSEQALRDGPVLPTLKEDLGKSVSLAGAIGAGLGVGVALKACEESCEIGPIFSAAIGVLMGGMLGAPGGVTNGLLVHAVRGKKTSRPERAVRGAIVGFG